MKTMANTGSAFLYFSRHPCWTLLLRLHSSIILITGAIIYKDWKVIVVVQLVYMQLCFMWVVNSFPKGGNKSIHVHIHTCVRMHAHTHKGCGQKNSKRSLSRIWFPKSTSYIIFIVPLIPLSLDDWRSQGAPAAGKGRAYHISRCLQISKAKLEGYLYHWWNPSTTRTRFSDSTIKQQDCYAL